MEKQRCAWSGADPLYIQYHDEEWGVPVHDDRYLFEMLCLEGAQAGLSWITILRKRPHYRAAFDNFDPAIIASYGDDRIAELMQNPGIVRNRLKVAGFVRNARALLQLQQDEGGFDSYLWQFVGGAPIINHWRELHEIPAQTPEAEAMSKALKKRGFTFVGPTICYAFMQATGMVNDHTVDCFRHPDQRGLSGRG
jgi:DNA-3-methyladenine glycosylase I